VLTASDCHHTSHIAHRRDSKDTSNEHQALDSDSEEMQPVSDVEVNNDNGEDSTCTSNDNHSWREHSLAPAMSVAIMQAMTSMIIPTLDHQQLPTFIWYLKRLLVPVAFGVNSTPCTLYICGTLNYSLRTFATYRKHNLLIVVPIKIYVLYSSTNLSLNIVRLHFLLTDKVLSSRKLNVALHTRVESKNM
jgi:hypothetical protein